MTARQFIQAIPRPIRALVPPVIRHTVKAALNLNRTEPDRLVRTGTVDRALAEAVAAVKWFHSIDLGNGVVTPGVDESSAKLRRIHMPASLAGRSVLDVGALDGFFSFEAEKRGATDVLAVDSFVWDNKSPPYGKAGFELARKVLKSNVKDLHLEVLDIAKDKVGLRDVVFFLGVFYHLEDPILALQKIAAVTREMLILETEVAFTLLNRSEMFFYPGAEYNRDASNWWVPTPAAVRDLLKTVGFKRVELVDRYTSDWFPRVGRAAFHAFK